MVVDQIENVAWKPLEGSQTLALSCPCNDILLEGSRGGGKTETQLIRYLKNVGRGYGKHWSGVLFDRAYKNLDDIVGKSIALFEGRNGARFLSSKSDYKWVWPSGEKLLFRHIKQTSDYRQYHGHEYAWIGWNELTSYPTSELFDLMLSCNRSSFLPEEHSPMLSPDEVELYKELRNKTGNYGKLTEKQQEWLLSKSPTILENTLPPIPLEVFSTTNPYGAGHNWVMKKYVDVAKAGRVIKKETEIFSPKEKKKVKIKKTQIRIRSSWLENRFLSNEYLAELENITDPNIRKAWLGGDWSISSGGAFDDLWSEKLYLDYFPIPQSWDTWRALDWGSSKPFSVGWWAKSDGEEHEVKVGNKTRIICLPRGSIIRFNEYYGTDAIGTNRGLRMGSKKVAAKIKSKEEAMLEFGDIAAPVRAGPADNSIWSTDDTQDPSVGENMASVGITWTKSVKSAGSRKNGLQLLRDRFEATRDGEGSGIYVFRQCKAFIETMKILPRDEDDPDDVDSDAEDHVYDESRYVALDNKPVYAKKVAKGVSILGT